MQAAFVSLCVQLTVSKAALVEKIRQIDENQAAGARNMYAALSTVVREVVRVRSNQAEDKADIDKQLTELSANHAIDSGNLYVELVEMRERWDVDFDDQMLVLYGADTYGDFYDARPNVASAIADS